MLEALNVLLHIVHISTIIFNLFGWIYSKTKKSHFIFILLTLFSWFGLGIFYGWGYCPVTDWHWQVQKQLGNYNLPNSYIKLLIDNVLRIDFSPFWTDVITLTLFLLAFILSIWVNFFNKSIKIKE